MNCHKCMFVGDVPGSAHRSCKILREADPKNAPLIEVMIVLGKAAFTYLDKESNERKNIVEIDEHGKKNGWADWPIQFDPVWIKNCIFFKTKENDKEGSSISTD